MKSLIRISFEDVCRECDISPASVQKFIDEEWLSPASLDDLEFDEEDLSRIILILELQEIFEVNDEAIPIILRLIDQLNHFQGMMKKQVSRN